MTTTARRLLLAMEADGALVYSVWAKRLRVSERELQDCRDGVGRLDPDVQMRLAGFAILLAPQHSRLARRLYAQAQAALRYAAALEDESLGSAPDRLTWAALKHESTTRRRKN